MNPWKKIQNEPVTVFKCNKNLKELIGSNKIENSVVKKINKSTMKPFLVFWKYQNSVLQPSYSNINFQESTDSENM